MPSLRKLVFIFGIPSLLIVTYGLYLIAGGMWGREYIKSVYARAISDATYTIRVAPNGGDCVAVGTWDGETRTCTLNQDLPPGANIFLGDDHLTLEGAGYALTADGQETGIIIIGNSDVVVRNLTIHGFQTGVYMQYAKKNMITGLSISGTSGNAIQLQGASHHNSIINNDIGPADGHGVALWFSDGNFIAGNRIHGTVDGIRLQSAHANAIIMNRVWNNEIEGIDLHLSHANRVVFNYVLEDEAIPIIDDQPHGSNLYSLTIGGNYYTQFDEPSEGCTDDNHDAFCDEEFRFKTVVDEKAFVQPALPRFAN